MQGFQIRRAEALLLDADIRICTIKKGWKCQGIVIQLNLNDFEHYSQIVDCLGLPAETTNGVTIVHP